MASRLLCGRLDRAASVRFVLAGLIWSGLLFCAPLQPEASAQTNDLTAVVLVNSTSVTGYNTNPSNPGEYQRYPERYLEHLQIPYRVIDVWTTPPPTNLSSTQLIIAAHRGLNLSSAWQQAIVSAVQGGTGFVNLDSDVAIGLQGHIQAIFGATGSTAGTPGLTITIPATVMQGGATPHYIAVMQRVFPSDPPGDLNYYLHLDDSNNQGFATCTVLTGARGNVIATVGNDPLILATSYGSGRSVHFATYDFMRPDRFGFMMGMDDLVWRSLVWAARKPFVVRGYPRFFTIQQDDNGGGWGFTVRDMYNASLTGNKQPDGTGGPWKPTGFLQLNWLPPSSSERAQIVSDIGAGVLQVAPHGNFNGSGGDLYWNLTVPNTDSQWLTYLNNALSWKTGNGGADTVPPFSRSVTAHYWDISNNAGFDMWNSIGTRYITTIQAPGAYYGQQPCKTGAQRLPLRPFRIYELPPSQCLPDERWPFYFADDITVGSRAGLPAQTFFGFATQLLGYRYPRVDAYWPQTSGWTVAQSLENFEYYTWRFWSGLAPVEIYTHDQSNMSGSSTADRQAFISQLSAWLNVRGVRHVFMQELGDYMRARTKSILVSGQATPTTISLTYTGNSATADGALIATKVLVFYGDNEGMWVDVPGFTGGSTYSFPSATAPAIGLDKSSLQYSAVPGTNPASQTVNITNTGGGTLNWSASTNASWLFVGPTSGTNNGTLTVSVNTTGLAQGTYQGTVTVAALGAGNSPQTVAVSLVYLPPTLGVSPTSLSFSGVQGQSNPPSQSVSVSNQGAGSLSWTSSASTTWLSASPASGTAPSSFNVSVNMTGLASGTYNGNIAVTSAGSSGSPKTIPVSLTVQGPPPTISSLSPGWATAGGAGFTLAVTGTNYNSGSVVQWNGGARATTYVSATQLTASILSGDIAAAGTATVTVNNPNPTGGTSNPQTFTIVAAPPAGGSVFFDDFNRANSATIGNGWIQKSAAAFSLSGGRVVKAATGTSFPNNVVYRPASENIQDGEASIELRFASLPPGYAQIFARAQTSTITNAGVLDGYLLYLNNLANQAILSRVQGGVTNDLVQIPLNPQLNTTDNYRLRLRVTGTNPVVLNGFVERLNGSAWDIIGQVTFNDTAATAFTTPGTTGFSGNTEGGVYSYKNFTSTNFGTAATPSTTSIAPSSATAGGPAFTLTVNGSNFVSGSLVQWNNSNRTTTFVSSTQLSAAIPASDIASAGTAQVTVVNPSPGGGSSNSQAFTINPVGSGGPNFFDDFNRPNSSTIGNGWIQKNPSAFSILNGRVVKAAAVTGFPDNVVYRQASENIQDGEASVEVRFASLPPGYPQIFVRAQTSTITNSGVLDGYLLYINNIANQAILSRVQGGNAIDLVQIPVNPQLNTSDNYRLRLRATNSNPVALTAFVERFNGTGWDVIGQTTFNDSSASRFTTPGTVGFSGYTEGGVYSYKNFARTSYDGQNPAPNVTAISPGATQAGAAGFTLTVTGSSFLTGSVVQWNGTSRPTTYISSTQLQAAISPSDVASAGTASVTVSNPPPGGGVSSAATFTILTAGTASFFDGFNRPDSSTLGNSWTMKYAPGFALQGQQVVTLDTGTIDYHDALNYRPQSEDQQDVEAGIEFVMSATSAFPQVHARIQRNTVTQPNTLDDYIFFVDSFAAAPGRAIIARQPGVTGQFECYMLAIPFPTPLQLLARYRLRFRVTGGASVVLNGWVEQFNGTSWQPFASGTFTHTSSTQPNPSLYCDTGVMPPPLTTAGAVGFGKWRSGNDMTYQNFSWVQLSALTGLSLNTTSVRGGNSVQGTAMLNGPAPADGAVVNLTSSNTAAATVLASVTIPAGATSATFTIATSTVSTSTSVTITASYGSRSQTATLTVTP